jgi:hypothetical protein
MFFIIFTSRISPILLTLAKYASVLGLKCGEIILSTAYHPLIHLINGQ